MTENEIRLVEEHCRHAAGILKDALAARSIIFNQALRDGWTHQQIADAAGLTRGRITQIITTASKEKP